MNTLATFLHAPQQPERPAAPIMDQQAPPIKILKIFLHNKPKSTCPALSQRELGLMPPKLLNTLIHEHELEDLDDIGTMVKVKDETLHEDIIRTVKWIKRSEAADPFPTPIFEVRRRNGDRKYGVDAVKIINDTMIDSLFLSHRESRQIRSEDTRQRRRLHCHPWDTNILCQGARPVPFRHQVRDPGLKTSHVGKASLVSHLRG